MKESGVDLKVIAMTLGLSLKSVTRILSGENMVGKVTKVLSRTGQQFCSGCRQWIKENGPCKRCERDRQIGSRVRARSRMVEFAIEAEGGDTIAQAEQSRQAHNRLAVELPEAMKLPRIRKWDNIEPLRPSDCDIVESIAMLVSVDEPSQLDEYDARWTVAKGDCHA